MERGQSQKKTISDFKEKSGDMKNKDFGEVYGVHHRENLL